MICRSLFLLLSISFLININQLIAEDGTETNYDMGAHFTKEFQAWEESIFLTGAVDSLDFSLLAPEAIYFTFWPSNEDAYGDLYYKGTSDFGISNNINIKTIFFYCNLKNGHFLQYAYMPSVVAVGTTLRKTEISSLKWIFPGLPNLETVDVWVREDITEGNMIGELPKALNATQVKHLGLRLDSADPYKTFNSKFTRALSKLKNLETLTITLYGSGSYPYFSFGPFYKEKLEKIMPNQKIEINFNIHNNNPDNK